jgi:hypothetical protein
MRTIIRATRTTAWAALAASVLIAAAALPGRAEEKLVAPVYPGAVRLSPAAVQAMEGVEFAVKDPHDKVLAFYVPKYARLPKDGEGRAQGTTEIPLIARSSAEVQKIILSKKGDFTLERAAEIIVKWQRETGAGANAATKAFFQLETQAKRHKTHDAELAELRAKYAFLKTAWYLEGKDQEALVRGGRESGNAAQFVTDKKILDAYNEEVKKAMAEGRYQDVAGLHAKYFGELPDAARRSKADNFAVWKKALEDLAAVSYQTKVTIDFDPNEWDVRWKK